MKCFRVSEIRVRGSYISRVIRDSIWIGSFSSLRPGSVYKWAGLLCLLHGLLYLFSVGF